MKYHTFKECKDQCEDCAVMAMLQATSTQMDKLSKSEFEPLAWCAICLQPGISEHPHKE